MGNGRGGKMVGIRGISSTLGLRQLLRAALLPVFGPNGGPLFLAGQRFSVSCSSLAGRLKRLVNPLALQLSLEANHPSLLRAATYRPGLG